MKKMLRPLLWTMFSVYCFVLIYILFLSRGSATHLSYTEYFRRYTNFIPFKTIVEYIERYVTGYRSLSVMNLLGNFVLFLPMGIVLPCTFHKLDRFWKVILCILGMVVLVEIAQGVLRVGSIDIDDVIFNVSGAMIGYGIIKIPFINKLLSKIGLLTV